MATSEPLVLDGCTPTPLASYLKGARRSTPASSPTNNVSGEAADPRARGWWENERFHLTTALAREDVLRFFLEDYAPSPIIAPWNGRAGFLEGEEQENSTRTGADLMRRFEASLARRFENMRRTIERSRANDELARLNRLRAKTKALKNELKTLQGEEWEVSGRGKEECREGGEAIQAGAASGSAVSNGAGARLVRRCLLRSLHR